MEHDSPLTLEVETGKDVRKLELEGLKKVVKVILSYKKKRVLDNLAACF